MRAVILLSLLISLVTGDSDTLGDRGQADSDILEEEADYDNLEYKAENGTYYDTFEDKKDYDILEEETDYDTLEEKVENNTLVERGQCLYRKGRPGFLCDNGQCIERGEVCNGKSLTSGQCDDGSDEAPLECCREKCSTASGVPVCRPDDGYDHTDEECRACTKGGYPGFRCNDGSCVYRRNRCDGRAQCNDGSDESDCDYPHPSCPGISIPRDTDPGTECRACHYNTIGDGFRCNNARCILGGWACDGSPDCEEGEDELDSVCRPQLAPETTLAPSPAPRLITHTTDIADTCPEGWSCRKYSDCPTFDSFLQAGGLFSEIRCDPRNLSHVCCDPEGVYPGYSLQETEYEYYD